MWNPHMVPGKQISAPSSFLDQGINRPQTEENSKNAGGVRQILKPTRMAVVVEELGRASEIGSDGGEKNLGSVGGKWRREGEEC